MNAATPVRDVLHRLLDGTGQRAEVPGWLDQLLAPLATAASETVERDLLPEVADALRRLGGAVPFRVVHDWYHRAVLPTLADATAEAGGDPRAFDALRRTHAEASEGRVAEEAAWRRELEPVLLLVYRNAFPYADFHRKAYRLAYADAVGHGRAPAEASRFAENSARRMADIDAACFAEANALANARALASAYATADAVAYRATYPSARVNAYLDAYAHHLAPRDPATCRRAAAERLAVGLALGLRTTKR
ncbi:hypothetical protein RM844_14265 [Streptomyces sp. DSM 44915]|uniref:SpcZ n=1 Tax=Streptomyces chisholmiae TaxID=3075540 RepID=A0ABU2JR41_9ACTN|nr:hypothetical protein [Streptomyces sp. DSM 44915]MDT0267452.1 hypothetical protein [Streptomyces sp. DSM 44915]